MFMIKLKYSRSVKASVGWVEERNEVSEAKPTFLYGMVGCNEVPTHPTIYYNLPTIYPCYARLIIE
jgi:hypothetical protein